MQKPVTREQKDANRKANFIEKNAALYDTDPVFKMMVDSTQYFTEDEIHASMGIVGGTPRNRHYLNL